MKQRRSRHWRHVEIGEHEAASYAKALNAKLLRLGAWCPIHQRGYSANHMVNDHIEAQGCPRCAAEKQWVRKAREQMVAEEQTLTGPALLARAESLAGTRLLCFHRYDDKDAS